jgi:membrane associated rhomboid family serine protease
MPSDVPLVPCVGCGTHVPRSEMFGHGTDLRCPDCAAALRDRMHPSNVRRSPLRGQLVASDVRVTGWLVGLIVVIWVAFQLDATREALAKLVFDVNLAMTASGDLTMQLAHAWQPLLWSVSHLSLVHILLNGLSLFQAGRLIEMGWGGRMLVFLALGAGTFGTASGWLVNGAPTIGLSGGIFGIYGFLIAMRRHHALAAAVVNRIFIHSLLASTVLLLVLTEVGGIPISHVGHASGFLFGYAAGVAARAPSPRPMLLLLTAALVGLCLLTPQVTPLGWDTTLFS